MILSEKIFMYGKLFIWQLIIFVITFLSPLGYREVLSISGWDQLSLWQEVRIRFTEWDISFSGRWCEYLIIAFITGIYPAILNLLLLKKLNPDNLFSSMLILLYLPYILITAGLFGTADYPLLGIMQIFFPTLFTIIFIIKWGRSD